VRWPSTVIYVAAEQHFGAKVWVTRKGAVRAGAGELGIIPGSMGAKSFIVRGKGNPESFHSCSHGAGRAIEVRLQGAAILLPREDLSPDDYSFQAPVKEVESFDMHGRRVTRLRCTVLRLDSDVDIDLRHRRRDARGRATAHRRRRARHAVVAGLPGQLKAD
jgi:hypothetical protein